MMRVGLALCAALLSGDGRGTKADDKRPSVTLVRIEPGTMAMGHDRGRANEAPIHKVTLREAFRIGKYEVTQQEYAAVMGKNPSRFRGPRRPVETVSWEQAVEFCRRLTDSDRKAGRIPEGHEYRLPAEAEWEYCCRAGTTTPHYFGKDASKAGEHEWTRDNSGGRTHDVGGKKPNPWGLHDMAGNVREWCLDWYGPYPNRAVTDPTGPEKGTKRVFRSGDWYYRAETGCTMSSQRGAHLPTYAHYHVGFRVVLAPGKALLAKRKADRLKKVRRQVEALVKQLGDRKYATRERAHKRIEALGADAREVLRAFPEQTDPEIRARIQLILESSSVDKKSSPVDKLVAHWAAAAGPRRGRTSR